MASALSLPNISMPEALVEPLGKLHEFITTHPSGVPAIDALSPTTRGLLASSTALALILRIILLRNGCAKAQAKIKAAQGGSGDYVDSEVFGKCLDSAQKIGVAAEREWEYDVIIVGGGTSGCALAARLSEDEGLKVLLLEAGGSAKVIPRSVMPAGFGGLLYDSKFVHQIRTEPQLAAGGKQNFWPRAKMLGGCSSINAQMAQYGAFGDYDQWAELTGDDSWAWKNFSAYFRKFEKFNPHPEYPIDTKTRGMSGPVDVGYFNTVTEPSKAFIKACVNVGIPFTPDFNGPNNTMGVSRVMTYVSNKFQRVSSETAYLTPDVLRRKNLTVVTNATVTRIIFDSTVLGTGVEPRVVGVEFAKSASHKRYKVSARKEVVLSGGAVHTPHLLMLSGVGPAAHLKKFNIPVVKDAPDVGQNLVDHPVIDAYFKDKFNRSAKFLAPKSVGDVIQVLRAVWQYKVKKTGGPLAMNFGESACFVRSDDPKLFPPSRFPEKLVDSTSAADSPDLEIFSTPFAYKEHGAVMFDVHTYAMHCYLVRPTSTGEVLLKSADPFVQPSVNPNYISTPEDLKKLARGLYLMLKIARAEPLASQLDATFTRGDLDHEMHLKSNEELEAVIKERVETVYHPTTTCKMAPESQGGVVDSQLRVYGIAGLRVCDASIFPWIISGHTAGACFAIAEKLADDMKAIYRSK